MERTIEKELRTLLEFIKEGYPSHGVKHFPQRVLSRLAKVAQLNVGRYNELGPPSARKNPPTGSQRRCSTSEAEPLARDIHKHAISSHHRYNPEVAHHHSFKSGLNGKFDRTLGLSHRTIAQLLKESATNHRTNQFEKHNELLERLTHHLLDDDRTACAATRGQQKLNVLEHALNTLNFGLVVLTMRGKIRLATPSAIRQMRHYFGQQGVDTNHLPQALGSWVKQQQRALRQKHDVSPPKCPMILEYGEKRLTIRFVLSSNENLLLLEEQLAATKCGSTVSCGLSRRENEVLQWLSQGKTNKEIAVILKLSARTVQKHLEHIYLCKSISDLTVVGQSSLSVVDSSTHAASIFSLANGMLSIKVCIGVLP
jgi:DNA-binding NarL/FixJ family response regulator